MGTAGMLIAQVTGHGRRWQSYYLGTGVGSTAPPIAMSAFEML